MNRKTPRPPRRPNAPAEPATAALFKRAMALHDQGKLAAAEAAYRQVLQAEPGHLDARNNLGNVLRSAGRQDAALACYGEVLAIDPRYALAHYNMANIWRDQGKLEDAAAAYRRTLELRPDYADACNNLGATLLDQGKIEEATACFYRVVALNPRHAFGHLNLGRRLRDQGKHAEALASLRRAVELAPRHPDARRDLGSVYRFMGKLDEAMACFNVARKLDPKHPMVHFGIAEILRAQGKLEAAAAAYRRAIQLDPDNADIHNNLGNLLLLLDRADEAQACYRRALALDPDHPDARMNYAIEDPFTPDDPGFERLKALLDRPDWTDDKRNQTVFALGRGHDAAGDYDQAMAYFMRGNAEMSQRTTFDRREHWDMIGRIKSFFPVADAPAAVGREPGRQTPAFVLGLSRSGKTLVESLLKQHPQVLAAGERYAFLDALDDIRKPAGIAERFPDYIPRLDAAHLAAVGARYMILLSRISKAELVTNTLPGHHLYLGLILRALPNAKVVFCRREPIDQCLRIYFKRYAGENEHAYTFENIVTFHDCYLDMMAHWRRLYGPRILEIRYEEMVRDPRTVAKALFAHLELDMDPADLKADFSTAEIGHWQNYKAYLGPLQAALAGLIV